MWRLAISAMVLLFVTAVAGLAQTPVVASGGVVDAATYSAAVVPGSLVAIFGSNLAAAPVRAESIPLPGSLAGVSVAFNGLAAPLLYVSPGQINAQLPWELTGGAPAAVVVTTGAGSSLPQAVKTAMFSPGLYAIQGQALATSLDGSLAEPSAPATPGDTLVVYATGLGAVDPPGVTGGNSVDTVRRTTESPTVLLGGAPIPVTFSGLSPQFVGVYQLNVQVPANALPAVSAPLQIQAGGLTSTAANVAIGAGFPQWGQNSQHSSAVAVAGQKLANLLADIVYDPLTAEEQAASGGELVVHYQVPLIDGNDVFMEFKSGTYNADSYASETWGENRYAWQNSKLVQVWSYASDWKPPGSSSDFWEPVFHAALANDAIYLPGASGSIIEVSKITGSLIRRIAPFGTDPNTYLTGPIAVDLQGNLFYNAIRVVVDPAGGFYANDAVDSWLVKVTPGGAFSMVSYKTLTSAAAPGPVDQCLTSFAPSQLPWPPGPAAIPASAPCGTERVSLNVAPAVAPDGTIYSVTHPQFSNSYAFLVAVNPGLTLKWAASLRGLFHDGCGVPVSAGGWLPADGAPGGCRTGAAQGVDPATNLPGDGLVIDDSSASPVVAPDGSVLLGTYSRYNYAQGHLVHFDSQGNYLGAFGFGWDTTPAIYAHGDTWSAVLKNNHYGGLGSYCDDMTLCPPDRSSTNTASPEGYFVTQISPALEIEWTFQNTNRNSCTRNPDGSLSCTPDHPFGFEWCVNDAVIDANGVVYANSEDGNLYAIAQGGILNQRIFQQLALGAAYTPASIGGDGRIYTQNDGHLFVAGN